MNNMIVVTATELPRVMQCIGSRLMATIMPPDAITDARNEGNAADWLANTVFNSGNIETMIGQKAYNGFVITAEMIEFVGEYLSALDCGDVQVETSWSGGPFEIRGRADHIIYHVGDTLTVDEFKYGWRPVEPEMNWTTISHAIGHLANNAGLPPPRVIHFRIHQPRPHHPDGRLRTWSIDYATLMELQAQIIARLSNPTEHLQTGPACYKCHAYLGCPAAAKMEANAIDATYDSAFSDQLSGEALAVELELLERASDVIETRLAAHKELANHRLQNGEIVPNYARDPQYGHTKWKAGITGPLLSATSKIDCNKPGTITPAEFLRRGGSQATYDALTERPMTGAKLRRIDPNKRAQRLLKR